MREPDPLTLRHPKVQRLRRLTGRRSAREAEGCFVIEGPKLLSEAISAGATIEEVFVAPGGDADLAASARGAGAKVMALASGVVARVSDTVTPQPFLAIVRAVDVALASLSNESLLVVCAEIRDPGNAGTVLRTAEAAGAGGVVCCDGSVDLYNPKTVRASAGSLFHIPVVSGGNAVEVLDEMARWGVRRLATSAHGGVPYEKVDMTTRIAIILGNEAHGLSSALDGHIDELVTIPMAGRTESLNVGMAAAAICFEAARQRRSAT